MPTYEYECKQCGTITEVFQSITEKPRRKLKAGDDPQCDCAGPVQRLIGSGGGIIFRGSGFYETDYRSDSYKKAAEADKTKKSDGGDGKSTSSESTTKSENKQKKKSESKSTESKAGTSSSSSE
ncbi:MAG: FmdB family zinc ribbon protein [Phycisphaerae bacterium]